MHTIFQFLCFYKAFDKLGHVADPVIEAIERLEFEDGLETGVIPRGCWYPCGGYTLKDQFCNTQGIADWSWGQCGCHKDPCQTK